MRTLPISEKAFLAKIMQLAYLKGWHVAHFSQAQVRPGTWVTPQSGHIGFLDLVLARRGVVLIREVKNDKGVLSPGQSGWLANLGDIGGVWRPADMKRIEKELA